MDIDRIQELRHKEALRRIEEAKKNKSTELDLSGSWLEELPIELKELTNLKSINLTFNRLTILPNWFANFTNLNSLDISDNEITNFPDWFANFTNLTSLNISGNGITTLPNWFANFTNLTSLNISENEITTLPDWFANFTNLTSLNISGNDITTLPDWFVGFTNLTHLDISNNKITTLPNWLANFTNLTSLNISGNDITTLPDWFANFTNLTHLDISNNKITTLPNWFANFTNLTFLNISGNYITTLPDWFANFTKLTSFEIRNIRITSLPDWFANFTNLTSLNISNNEITTLPNWLANFTNLTSLVISSTRITSLPDWFANFTNLALLDISFNEITTLPDWIANLNSLVGLFIYKTKISKLPSSITNLKKLQYIRANKCPLVEPPIEIAKQGVKSIFDYFNSMYAGSVKVHEAKLMIVGEPGAGKTTLRRKLIDPDADMPKKEETTRGIDIDKWEYDYENNNYTVNLWDFGGQQILQSTHQFFMCERALYILLADTRKENTDYFDWLHRIELFAGNSPTVIIHNEIGDRNRQINMSKIKKHFPHIPEPMRCNLDKINGTERKKDFYNIVDELKHKIKHLEVIGQEFPKAWIDLRQELEKIHKEEKLHYISSERYFTLCDEFKINKDSALTLSRYLHAIGAILFFDNDPILKHTVILNPEWGTDAVYKVIEDTKVQSNNGKFYKKDIKRIWADPIYKDKYDELLRLMINFKLCYKANNCYILPQLLPYQPEDTKYQWDSDSNLYFEYRYPDYYLNSIMIRFIVAMNEYIESQKTVWCNGVILSKDNDRAEIVADKENRTIHIRVCGTTRRDFLTIIRKEFDDIHKQYKKLKVEQMVPCNCDSCKDSQNPTLFPYSKLINRLEHRKYTIECDTPPFNKIEISSLINDFTQFDIGETVNDMNKILNQFHITAEKVQINQTDISGDDNNCNNTMGDRNKVTSSVRA